MCCNRSNNNNNNNVQGNSGRRGCGNNENVGGATRIALRGPGCINGTGRCLRQNESVQGDSGTQDIWPCENSSRGNFGRGR